MNLSKRYERRNKHKQSIDHGYFCLDAAHPFWMDECEDCEIIQTITNTKKMQVINKIDTCLQYSGLIHYWLLNLNNGFAGRFYRPFDEVEIKVDLTMKSQMNRRRNINAQHKVKQVDHQSLGIYYKLKWSCCHLSSYTIIAAIIIIQVKCRINAVIDS